MLEAVCYARVSTQEQALHGVSLDAQVERLESYCGAMGLHVVRVIREEGVSAGKPLATRPGGAKLLKMLERHEVSHVVALKLDRLFRSTEDALQLTRRWDTDGVVLHLCDMGGQNLNTRSAMGRMMLTMLASFAEFERNLIAERTSAALLHKKSKKQAYNHVPFGFQREGKSLVPFEPEQKVLKHMFAWRKEGMSFYDIATRLNDLGIATKKKRRWHAETVRHILQNSLYREPVKAENLISWEEARASKEPAEIRLVEQVTDALQQLGSESATT